MTGAHGGILKLEMYARIWCMDRSIGTGCSLSGTLLLEDKPSVLAFKGIRVSCFEHQ